MINMMNKPKMHLVGQFQSFRKEIVDELINTVKIIGIVNEAGNYCLNVDSLSLSLAPINRRDIDEQYIIEHIAVDFENGKEQLCFLTQNGKYTHVTYQGNYYLDDLVDMLGKLQSFLPA